MAASREGDAWILREVSPSFLFFFGLLLAPSLWLQAQPGLESGAGAAVLRPGRLGAPPGLAGGRAWLP